MFNSLIVENELTKRLDRTIRFSYQTYFSDDFRIYRKLFIDNEESNIKIFFDALQEAAERGTLESKYKDLEAKARMFLLLKDDTICHIP